MPVLFLLMLSGKGWAQAPTTAASGFTPEGLKTGAPAGSFQLSGFDNINYFNGNLNFNLPLLQVGGRGKTGYTIPLKIENKWLVKKTPAIAGFTNTPEPNSWQKVVTPGYGPGVLIGRVVGALGQNCGQAGNPITETLTRLTFTAGDGTEYQLRDTTFRNGLDFETTWSDCNVGDTLNRGKHFVGDDGSGVTFVSDEDIFDAYNGAQTEQIAPSGYLMLPDGTRYRIEDGIVRWMRDRNGNKMSFGYASGDLALITDSLNRQVTITLFDAAQSRFYDEITYKGFGGADRKIRVGYKLLSQVLISGQTMSFHALFPELSLTSVTMTIFDQWVPSSVDLPDGRSYQFKYNAYGELARVELPTGGAIEYDYLEGLVDNTPLTGSGVYPLETGEFVPHQIYRRVSQRRVYADKNSTVFEHQMTISRPEGLAAEQNLGYVDVETWAYPGKDAGGALLSKERHYYYGSAKVSPTQEPINYSEWKTGKEWKTEVFAADGVTVINRVENTWQQPQDGFSWPLTAPETNDAARPNNPKITQTIKVLAETNQVSKQTFAYDKHFNQTDVYEYDFGAGSAPAIPTRHSHTNFLTLNPANGINYADPANVAVGYTLSDYHIRNLPENQTVYSVHPATGAETLVARTDYEYDRYDTNHHAALVPRSNISGLCNNTSLNCPNEPDFTNPGYQIRGNVTEVKRYSNAASLTGAITTYQQYDVAGNVVKAIDAGRADGTRSTTIVDYVDRFGAPDGEAQQNTPPTNPNWLNGQSTFAFATKVTNSLGHIAYTQHDYFLGKPVNSEDPNGVVSSIFYADDLDRPTVGIRAVGSPVANQVVFYYNDSNNTVNDNPPHSITTIGDINTFGQSSNGNGMKSLALYDGLGRTWRSAVYEIKPEADNLNKWAITQTKFDALGRTWKVSNPFRLFAADGQEGTLEWTTTTYDALSRVTEVMTPDGAKVKTVYSGSTVTVTDQDNKSRSSLTDGLGRLTRVIEDPGAGKLNYRTDYTYDALDNLTKVRQGGFPLSSGGNVIQTRTFLYDSLSRLLYANNPEQDATIQGPSGTYWTMKYGYDPNGNLTSRTDARDIIATYSYDALNRNIQVSYNDNKTPTVTRFYDTAPNGKGRLQRVETENRDPRNTNNAAFSQTVIAAYDALGRVTSQKQRFATGSPASPTWWPDYAITRTYDLAGHVKHQNYPFAGRYVDYEYNDSGRLKNFTGNLMGFGSPTYYATSVDNSGIRYNAAGQMLYEVFGTSPALLAHRVNYNNRFQMTETKLGTDVGINDSSASSTWTRGKLKFDYGTTDNNGNVRWQEHLVPTSVNSGSAPTIPDSVTESVIPMRDEYLYDELNRITKVTGNKVVGSTTTQIYTQAYSYDRFGNRKINAAQTSGTGVNKRVYNPNPLNNRLRELVYDKAGNVLSETLYGSRLEVREYDAENRMTRAASNGGAQQNYYVYDGDGRRVRRIVGGEETWQVYGIDGELLAEYKLTNGTPEATPSKEYGYRNGQLLIVGDKAENKVWWLVTDHLGTSRIEVDQTGALTSSSLKRHDYLPFGEEVKVGVGTGSIRTTGMGYEMGQAVGARRQKFGSKERDAETDLDYFVARYYSSTQGRFITPDWSAKPVPVPYANFKDPQTFNLYGYVRNNPVWQMDDDGHGWWNKFKNWATNGGWTDDDKEAQKTRHERQVRVARFYANEWAKENPRAKFDPSRYSDEQILKAFQSGAFSKTANDPLDPLQILGVVVVYRGGPLLLAREIDVKLDKETGLVRPEKGVSVNSNPTGLERFGGAYKVESVPPELEVIQRGSPNHYEIVPRQAMTFERYQELLNQVKLVKVTPP